MKSTILTKLFNHDTIAGKHYIRFKEAVKLPEAIESGFNKDNIYARTKKAKLRKKINGNWYVEKDQFLKYAKKYPVRSYSFHKRSAKSQPINVHLLLTMSPSGKVEGKWLQK